MTILKRFLEKECEPCGGYKRPHTAFCVGCYGKLPANLRRDLWKRFGEGFEEAYDAALRWLRDDDAETDKLLAGA